MMNKLFLTLIFFLGTVAVSAQDVQLPAPVRTGGLPLMDALNKRQSVREYSAKAIESQKLSNLLWAAYGFNRDDKRTAPSANNRQELEVYVALPDGFYLYDAKANKLTLCAKGDYRKDTGGQDFVATAALNLVYVANLDKANRETAGIDCGFISQNVYLFCASEGLATVVRGSVNKDNLKKILKLTDKQEIILAQTVGYSK
ncbi:MAG: SagB/ThcOx family dehydrogenase [Bacteroidales bacterium]|jgi:SagB-type dehydrogenase family enzyme|nr:SagB/ThcOx family dehydrogenase [Bacteroidales bacterium]